MTFLHLMPLKWWLTLAVLLTGALGLYLHGNARYNDGVRVTTAKFLKADIEGAETVHETARKTIDDIGDDFDVDRLLDATNGFRDD